MKFSKNRLNKIKAKKNVSRKQFHLRKKSSGYKKSQKKHKRKNHIKRQTLKIYLGGNVIAKTDASGNVIDKTDASGNVIAKTDASGNVIANTDASGNVIANTDASGANVITLKINENNYNNVLKQVSIDIIIPRSATVEVKDYANDNVHETLKNLTSPPPTPILNPTI